MMSPLRIEVEPRGGPGQATLAAVMRALGDEETGLGEIALLVQKDAALSTAVLRLANSRYYGLAGAVETVRFACSVLGGLGLRSVVLAEMARRAGPPLARLEERLERARECAPELAVTLGVDPEVALALVIVAHVGELLIVGQDPLGYDEASRLAGEERDEFERERYGETRREITVRALRRWHLPEEFALALEKGEGVLGTLVARLDEECGLGERDG
jgi:HD-like signal output (HDOD) protein